jgi:hypothetical protein
MRDKGKGVPPPHITVNVLVPERRSPEDAGLRTQNRYVPADPISVVSIRALSNVTEINHGVLFGPFHWTLLVLVKLFPGTEGVNAAPPAFPDVGETDVIPGTGLFTGKVTWFENGLPGAGFCTCTRGVLCSEKVSRGDTDRDLGGGDVACRQFSCL